MEEIEDIDITPEEDKIKPSGPAKKLKFDAFFFKNRNIIFYTLGGLLLVIVGFIAYRTLYIEPQEQEAENHVFTAQRLFESDSFNLALKGTGGDLGKGFNSIADDYSGTKIGNLSYYYIGMAKLQTGKYQEAIDNLENYHSDSRILMPMALGGIGDAYSELKNYDKASDYYLKAAKKDDNEFTAPRYYKKAGLTFEELGKLDDALAAYQVIKDKYGKTREGSEIDKYIARVQAKLDMKK